MWLAAEPSRLPALLANMGAAVRAGRLAVKGGAIVLEYRRARRWDLELPADLVALEERHLELQKIAGQDEHARALASERDAPASERAAAAKKAEESRLLAVRIGEEIALRRVTHGHEAGMQDRWDALHTKCALSLLDLCIANGGVYVKLGQHVAQLDYLVPEAYTRTLSALFATNRASPWSDVREIVEADLGAPIEELFDSFDVAPLASASLAQVHAARERGTGRRLAVKVQHAGLAEAAEADLLAVRLAVAALTFFFPRDFRLSWVVDELTPHLPRELDFEHEAANLARCRAFFAAKGDDGDGADGLRDSVATPEVIARLSSRRVLTMTYEDGASVADREAILRMGLRPADVSALLTRAFNAQIFGGGFVHCDPHPGNVLVRPRADAPALPQLVLLDHGLYRELPRTFVTLYARLWHAVLQGDADGIRTVSHELGVGECALAHAAYARQLCVRQRAAS